MTHKDPIGWDRLNHGGLLLDPQRLQEIKEYESEALPAFLEQKLQRQRTVLLGNNANPSSFVAFILDDICGFTEENGIWHRGSGVSAEWGRINITRETVKPNHLWLGKKGGVLPIFIDKENRIGIGRGRRMTRQALQWLRAGPEQLAVITNGHQWRLIFAGLDFDAWCEWDVEQWFEEGDLSTQVMALRTLLSPKLWTPASVDRPSPLLQAILDSRKGQAELSMVLGERVRQAVEILVRSHGESLKEYCDNVNPVDIYGAAVRIVMRMVVALFAESRDLLPRSEDLYHSSYGLTGLFEALEKADARGGNRLSLSESGWPRVLALFRLVHEGSHHPSLIVQTYGGELFAPGDRNSPDGLSRALAVFESACFDLNHQALPDCALHRMLTLITRTRIKIRHGRSRTWIQAPIDFSDLSSEYIGILYEGLLDFELKTAPPGEAMIFLEVGNQPVLPLNRLKVMDDKALKSLLKKSKDTLPTDHMEEEGEAVKDLAEDETEEHDADDGFDVSDSDETQKNATDTDEHHSYHAEIEKWACHAVKVANLVRKPQGRMTPEKRRMYDSTVTNKAHQLVDLNRVVLPGEWYLARWGGTRKGSGTFYTRPSLAMPTVQRTLRPLTCNPPIVDGGKLDHDAPPDMWTPKRPEEILALKVCDPACGSGSFPVATLRFLTDTLYASLHYHERIATDGNCSIVALLTGRERPEEHLCEELLPCRPEDELFEPRLKAVLRRYVVERCVYGVDLDPLAVDLCRLTLWIETMDRTLPFSFLDHKIKCGNSLIGTWFDQFQHYPVMAWKNREGGDKNHSNGVHFQKNKHTKAIKAFVKDTLTPDLDSFLADRPLISEDMQEKSLAVHKDALSTLLHIHELPVQNSAERASLYRGELLNDEAYRSLKKAMDIWCACWFWPIDELEHAPLPSTLADSHKITGVIAARIAEKKRFFHWEVEFPDVFQGAGSGFDAILGNPPWDIVAPKSQEFFSNIDPLYRSYGRQEALRCQTRYFGTDKTVEQKWLIYIADFRAQTNFVKYCSSPFGDPIENNPGSARFSIRHGQKNNLLHTRWRNGRTKSASYADSAHPFRHQGSASINLYKLFLEQAHALLHHRGRLGFIVPSGLYSDHGTGGLRQLFLERCCWEWMFNFINSDNIFPSIHSNSKFNVIIIQKGGTTEAIRTIFLRKQLEDWERAENLAVDYRREWIERFSPHSKVILEIQSSRDLEILDTIYTNSTLLDDKPPEGWGITYAIEFGMTSDSNLFHRRPEWEKQGYRPDEYSRWLKGAWHPLDQLWAELGITPPKGERVCAQPPYNQLPIPRANIFEGIILSREADAWIREDQIEDTALPLYEGRMIGQLDFSQKGWVRGTGRAAQWRNICWLSKTIDPQFLMASKTYATANSQDGNAKALHGLKLGFMDIGNATNTRSMTAGLVNHHPCGHSVSTLRPQENRMTPILAMLLNSYGYDYVMRRRLAGLHMSYFILAETPLPSLDCIPQSALLQISISASMGSHLFADAWIQWASNEGAWRTRWAVTSHERARVLAMCDAVCFSLLGFNLESARYVLSQCDYPSARANIGTTDSLNPVGFWRIDKEKPPEIRHSILALIAFHDLQSIIEQNDGNRKRGIEEFCKQNSGEGWMLPEKLCLADYGLGHDERAKHHQPVASCLGPRFYDWQLAQDAEESWRECHLHARNLLGENCYKELLRDIAAEKAGVKPEAPASTTPVKANIPRPLFD